MKRAILAAGVFFLFFLFSCQKESSFEAALPASGSLQDSLGDCMDKVIEGTYTANVTLGDTNYIDVKLNISQPGPYTITTDTVNGYSFHGSGTFTNIGPNTARLTGIGKPLAAGGDVFTVIFDSTECEVTVTVGSGGGSTGSSVYAINCANTSVAGTYVQGTALNSTNKVTLQVTVTQPGTWTITTPSVSGMTFSGTGNFTTTGTQTITLNGAGTPTAGGNAGFTINGGTASCTFTVPVTASPNPAPGVYFPVTQTSWWTYDEGTPGTDTMKTLVTGTKTFLGNTYQQFYNTYEAGAPDTSFYRKDANTNFYYQYIPQSFFTSAGVALTFPQGGIDVLFLKDVLATGDTWNSDHSATFSGLPVTIRFKFDVVNGNATQTINGQTFTNVYQVKLTIQMIAGTTVQDLTTPAWMFYYAKGVGMIKFDDGQGFVQAIRYYHVI